MYRRLGGAVLALCGPMLLAACGGGGSEAGESASPEVVASAENSTAPGGASAAPGGSGGGSGSGDGKVHLGPDGYGRLKLGMKRAEAESAGLIVVKSEPPAPMGCGAFDLKEFPRKAPYSGGSFSAELGIATISAVEGMSTPEGIALGSPASAVKKAYPKLQNGPNLSFVTVPGNPEAVYTLSIDNGRVQELALDLAKQTCHN